MRDTKEATGKTGGVGYYHMILSFKPGEITPEDALEIAKEFAEECLSDYEVVIGTHVDKEHIHSHILFNSVNRQTGEKFHINNREYYEKIRAVSDRLCRKYGLSIAMDTEEPPKALSYGEWLRLSRGEPT